LFITGLLIDRTVIYAMAFLLAAGVALFGALFFGLFASGDRKIN
jgi:hypothetical protein